MVYALWLSKLTRFAPYPAPCGAAQDTFVIPSSLGTCHVAIFGPLMLVTRCFNHLQSSDPHS